MNSNPKVLLIQLFSNGDCLYATVVARQIKKDFGNCHLTWVIAEYCKDIISNNPFVDEVITIEGINFKNWKEHWPSFTKRVKDWEDSKTFDHIFLTQIIDTNFANYDYCIRSAIYRAYSGPIDLPVTPILRLTDTELQNVKNFALQHGLENFKDVILLEFAPRSGQARFSLETAVSIIEKLREYSSTVFILSSNTKITSGHSSIIDGSVLSLRETAALARYCSLLVGCSSGITWVTTSEAGKKLNMIQISDPDAYWMNSVVEDHKRYGMPVDHIIEITDRSDERIFDCIKTVLDSGFYKARELFHTEIPVNFKVSRGIVSYLMGKGKIGAAIRHARINLNIYGPKLRLLKSLLLGFLIFPLTNLINSYKEKRRS